MIGVLPVLLPPILQSSSAALRTLLPVPAAASAHGFPSGNHRVEERLSASYAGIDRERVPFTVALTGTAFHAAIAVGNNRLVFLKDKDIARTTTVRSATGNTTVLIFTVATLPEAR